MRSHPHMWSLHCCHLPIVPCLPASSFNQFCWHWLWKEASFMASHLASCGDLLQGTHTAMKSGMLAAQATFSALTASPPQHTSSSRQQPVDLSSYQTAMEGSYVWDELRDSRNIRPGCGVDLLSCDICLCFLPCLARPCPCSSLPCPSAIALPFLPCPACNARQYPVDALPAGVTGPSLVVRPHGHAPLLTYAVKCIASSANICLTCLLSANA